MIVNESFNDYLIERDFFAGRGFDFEGNYGTYKINASDGKAFLDWQQFGNTFDSAKKYVSRWKSLGTKNYEIIRDMIIDDIIEHEPDVVDIKYPRFSSRDSSEENGIAVTFKIYSADEETSQDKDINLPGDFRDRKNYSHRGLFQR